MSDVTMDASVMTKITAPDMPSAVLSFFETPRNGQMPRILESTKLLTRIAPMVIAKILLAINRLLSKDRQKKTGKFKECPLLNQYLFDAYFLSGFCIRAGQPAG
jgi:hypothetical protein